MLADGTVVRVVSDRFGAGTRGKVGTVTGGRLTFDSGPVYYVILEGSPAGTFHYCGELDVVAVKRGARSDAPIRAELDKIAAGVDALRKVLDGGDL